LSIRRSPGGIYFIEEVQMLGRIKKGESVIGMRAVRVKDWTFFKGPPIVRGSYAGKMRDWYMVQTRRMDDDIITISDFRVSVA